jgi:hypothetical protein
LKIGGGGLVDTMKPEKPSGIASYALRQRKKLYTTSTFFKYKRLNNKHPVFTLYYASPGVFFLYHAFKQTSLIRCEQF